MLFIKAAYIFFEAAFPNNTLLVGIQKRSAISSILTTTAKRNAIVLSRRTFMEDLIEWIDACARV